ARCPRPPGSPLFPYTTLFRSDGVGIGARDPVVGGDRPADDGQVEEVGDPRDRRVRVPDRRAEEARPLLRDRLQRLDRALEIAPEDRKSTRLNSSHVKISYAVF